MKIKRSTPLGRRSLRLAGVISLTVALLWVHDARAQQNAVVPQGTVRRAPATAPNSLRVVPSVRPAAASQQIAVDPGELGDPTVPSPRIREMLEADPSKRQAAPSASGAPAAPRAQVMPEIQLKARILGRGMAPIAVVEISGYRVTLTTDMVIPLATAKDTGTDLELKVIEINLTQVRLQLLNRGITVREIQLN